MSIDKITNKSIISLVPSVTEILYYLKLEQKLIGVTKHCNYPEEAKDKCKVGTFANPQLMKILCLKPDIVIADEVLHRKLIEELLNNEIKVLTGTTISVEDIFVFMRKLEYLCHNEISIQPLINTLEERIDKLRQVSILKRPRVFFLMSMDPFFTPGVKSFQYNCLQIAQAQLMDFQSNVSYDNVSWEQIKQFDPEVILYCGVEKGQPVPEKCIGCISKNPICRRTVDDIITEEWQHITAVRENKMYPISCDTICRPGPRSIDGIEKLNRIFKI
ncbi:MAG: Fe3+-hydroxamate ABC transporter substrate-binding protein [Firmicutes bacterium HGW-Firmicutes-12]|jgi:iron complex transport system substrate-binding protein|nr:MAG: Fe3+-hydroxamate ABC transporter substrate-binding protein [Firmicutes bacterium HGW-Firmicutes-12]